MVHPLLYQHWFTVTPSHRRGNITDSHGRGRDAVSPVTVSLSSSSTQSLSLRTMSLTNSALFLTRWVIYSVTTLCECMPMCVTVSVSLALDQYHGGSVTLIASWQLCRRLQLYAHLAFASQVHSFLHVENISSVRWNCMIFPHLRSVPTAPSGT